MFRLGARSKKRMVGIDPRLIEIVERAIQITVLDFGVPEYGGLRTTDDQALLFARNVSKADGVNDRSNHQDGNALDFYAIDPDTGKASWEIPHLALVACALLQAASELGYRLKSGVLWGRGPYRKGFTDMPHVELDL